MSQCVVPNWNNLRVHNNKHQRQRQDLSQAEEGNNSNRSSHVDLDSHLQGFSQIVPMSNFEELTWENGQLAMHELGGMFPPPPRLPSSTSSSPQKPTWGGANRSGDTLESIVHQATYCNTQGLISPTPKPVSQYMENVGSSGGKWAENSGPMQNTIPPPPPPPPGLIKKRTRSESEHSRLPNNDRDSACASANAAFCRDSNKNDTTMMTWASYESLRTKTTTDEDSACHGASQNHEEERETKEETGRSSTTRKGRAAAVHNQSERRRRDRINQKMKALQKLVPNASKTDKASMLDEVIEYLKQLQSQVQMMSNARFMPQIMMSSLGMQQHLQQMSLLARMGMGAAGLGMGLGMLDTTTIGHNPTPPHQIPHLLHPNQVPTATSAFVPPGAFVVPQMIPQTQQPNSDPGSSSSAPLQDPYTAALFAQSMNMDLYNRMATLHRQQQQQQTTAAQTTSNQLHSNHHVQGG